MNNVSRKIFAAIAGVGLVVGLTACGPSIEEMRSDAYSQLDELSHINNLEKAMYEQRISTATDETTIDRVVADAQSVDQERATRDAKQKAEREAERERVLKEVTAHNAELKKLVEGKTWTTNVGNDTCTISFYADGRVDLKTWFGFDDGTGRCFGVAGKDYSTINRWSVDRQKDTLTLIGDEFSIPMAVQVNKPEPGQVKVRGFHVVDITPNK